MLLDAESVAWLERHLKDYFFAHQDSLPASGMYDRIVHEVERPLIELCLAATSGNQIRAAKLLGINRNTLRKKIRDLDIQVIRKPYSSEELLAAVRELLDKKPNQIATGESAFPGRRWRWAIP